jgi:hypothetical protein
MYLSSTAFRFHFHSRIPKIYTFQTWYSPSLHHSFLCLGSPCHPNSNASTQCLQHSPWADAGVQNIRTQLAYEHVSNGFFTQFYHNRNNQLTVDSHWPIHWNQLVTSSHSGVAVQSSLVTFVFSKQFSSFRLLSCSIQCSAHSTHTSLYNKSPWSYHTLWYGTQSHAPNPLVPNP